jgi:DNA-directed RNA polymerase subunit RPC12/RpoP
VANFVRAAGFALFLALGALGFALVGVARTDQSVSTTALVIRGEVPVIVGFVLCWGALELADRLDSRPCPRCGRRVRAGTYACAACGYDFRRLPAPIPQG